MDAFVEAFAALRLPLHALVNCAGVCMPAFSRTPDGFEARVRTPARSNAVPDAHSLAQVQLGTNHVGPSYRTLCLLPALRAAAAPGAPPGRVVFIASNAPHFAPPLAALLRARDVGGAALTQTGFREYACSKAYGVLFARALAARLAAETPPAPLLVSVAHPGFVATPIQSKATGLASALVRLIAQLFALSPARGAHSTLYAATAPAVRSGEGFGPSDYNRGLTMPWAPRGDIFDAPDAADVLFDETLRVLADKGRAVSI